MLEKQISSQFIKNLKYINCFFVHINIRISNNLEKIFIVFLKNKLYTKR